MVETMKKIISFLCVGLLGGCFSLGYFYYQSQTADFQIKDIQGNRDVLKNMEIEYTHAGEQSYLKSSIKDAHVSTKIVKESPTYDVLNPRLYDDIKGVDIDRIGKETSNPWLETNADGSTSYQQKIDEAQLVYYMNGQKVTEIRTDIVEHSDDSLSLYLKRKDGRDDQTYAREDDPTAQYDFDVCVAIPMSDGAYYFMPEINNHRSGQNYIYRIKDFKAEKFVKLPQRNDSVLLRNKDLLIVVSYDKPNWYFTGYDLQGNKQYELKIESIENCDYDDLSFISLRQNNQYINIKINETIYVIDADRGKIVDSFQDELSYIQDMYYKDGKLYLLGRYQNIKEKETDARIYVYEKSKLLYVGSIYEWELYKLDGGGYTYDQNLGFRMNFKR